MGLITDIAAAVVTELNAPPSPFSLPFTAVRAYRPAFDLVALKSLQVTVVAKGVEISSLARSTNQHDVTVDVAVQKKVAPEAAGLAELDGLMTLTEEIADFLRLKRLTAFPTALWNKTIHVPVYAPEHLEQKQVFTSVLSMTFRVVR